MKSVRSRSWLIIVYPESAPSNWQSILADSLIPCAISPCHDLDKNPDGTLKKPHFHVILHFDNVKTIKQVQEISDSLSGVLPIVCNSPSGAFRYLTHDNATDKVLYNSDPVLLNGFSVPSAECSSIGRDIISFILDNNITSLPDLISLSSQFEGWTDYLLSHNSYLFIRLIESLGVVVGSKRGSSG